MLTHPSFLINCTRGDVKMPEYKKLQTPLTDGESFYYPVTTYDQIIMPDGISRWDGTVGSDNSLPEDWAPTIDNIEGLSEALRGTVVVERNGTEEPGLPAPNDADMLGGIPAEDYALKTDIPDAPSSLPSGGTPGQVLSVISDDGDVAWVDANTDTTVDWSEIQNVPTEFTPAEHTHDVSWDEVQSKPTQFSPTTHAHTSSEISDVSIEEWMFTLEDGSTVTKKVLTCVRL